MGLTGKKTALLEHYLKSARLIKEPSTDTYTTANEWLMLESGRPNFDLAGTVNVRTYRDAISNNATCR